VRGGGHIRGVLGGCSTFKVYNLSKGGRRGGGRRGRRGERGVKRDESLVSLEMFLREMGRSGEGGTRVRTLALDTVIR